MAAEGKLQIDAISREQSDNSDNEYVDVHTEKVETPTFSEQVLVTGYSETQNLTPVHNVTQFVRSDFNKQDPEPESDEEISDTDGSESSDPSPELTSSETVTANTDTLTEPDMSNSETPGSGKKWVLIPVPQKVNSVETPETAEHSGETEQNLNNPETADQSSETEDTEKTINPPETAAHSSETEKSEQSVNPPETADHSSATEETSRIGEMKDHSYCVKDPDHPDMNKTFFPDVMSELPVARSGQSESHDDFSDDDDNSIPLTQMDNNDLRGRLVSYSSSPNTSSAVDTDIVQSQVLNTTGTDTKNAVDNGHYVPDTQTESDSNVSRPRTAQSSEVVPETQSEPEDLSAKKQTPSSDDDIEIIDIAEASPIELSDGGDVIPPSPKKKPDKSRLKLKRKNKPIYEEFKADDIRPEPFIIDRPRKKAKYSRMNEPLAAFAARRRKNRERRKKLPKDDPQQPKINAFLKVIKKENQEHPIDEDDVLKQAHFNVEMSSQDDDEQKLDDSIEIIEFSEDEEKFSEKKERIMQEAVKQELKREKTQTVTFKPTFSHEIAMPGLASSNGTVGGPSTSRQVFNDPFDFMRGTDLNQPFHGPVPRQSSMTVMHQFPKDNLPLSLTSHRPGTTTTTTTSYEQIRPDSSIILEQFTKEIAEMKTLLMEKKTSESTPNEKSQLQKITEELEILKASIAAKENDSNKSSQIENNPEVQTMIQEISQLKEIISSKTNEDQKGAEEKKELETLKTDFKLLKESLPKQNESVVENLRKELDALKNQLEETKKKTEESNKEKALIADKDKELCALKAALAIQELQQKKLEVQLNEARQNTMHIFSKQQKKKKKKTKDQTKTPLRSKTSDDVASTFSPSAVMQMAEAGKVSTPERSKVKSTSNNLPEDKSSSTNMNEVTSTLQSPLNNEEHHHKSPPPSPNTQENRDKSPPSSPKTEERHDKTPPPPPKEDDQHAKTPPPPKEDEQHAKTPPPPKEGEQHDKSPPPPPNEAEQHDKTPPSSPKLDVSQTLMSPVATQSVINQLDPIVISPQRIMSPKRKTENILFSPMKKQRVQLTDDKAAAKMLTKPPKTSADLEHAIDACLHDGDDRSSNLNISVFDGVENKSVGLEKNGEENDLRLIQKTSPLANKLLSPKPKHSTCPTPPTDHLTSKRKVMKYLDAVHKSPPGIIFCQKIKASELQDHVGENETVFRAEGGKPIAFAIPTSRLPRTRSPSAAVGAPPCSPKNNVILKKSAPDISKDTSSDDDDTSSGASPTHNNDNILPLESGLDGDGVNSDEGSTIAHGENDEVKVEHDPQSDGHYSDGHGSDADVNDGHKSDGSSADEHDNNDESSSCSDSIMAVSPDVMKDPDFSDDDNPKKTFVDRELSEKEFEYMIERWYELGLLLGDQFKPGDLTVLTSKLAKLNRGKVNSKIDALRMFHAIAKPLPEYAGGTHLMRHVAHYAEKHRKKYEEAVNKYYRGDDEDSNEERGKSEEEESDVDHFDIMITELKDKSRPGDEVTLYLTGKWLRRNITVVSPKGMWSLYKTAQPDIVLTFKGVDQKDRLIWGATEVTKKTKVRKSSRPAKPKKLE